jgi:undecaprenyl-diphosphatase
MKNWLTLFIPCALISAFIVLSSEVREANSGQIEMIAHVDQAILQNIVALRTPSVSDAAVDLTALGSGVTIAVLISFCALFFFLQKSIATILQLLVAAIGAGLLTHLLKGYFERSRPEIALRLVEVQGFSYPSGHSLASAAFYFSLALIVCRFARTFSARTAIIIFFLGLISLIGLTRMYLGVHYFSDVTAGILLGIAWALAVDFVFQRKIGFLKT